MNSFFANIPSISSSSISSLSSSSTLRDRRGVTFYIEFTRPLLNLPAKGQLGPAAGALPRRRRAIIVQSDDEDSSDEEED